jgi:hypothetical protein
VTDPQHVPFESGRPNRADMSRMFMVYAPAPNFAPIYWTASRKASGSVSLIAYRYGKSWEEMVLEGYSLRKCFYNAINVTYRTFNDDFPTRTKELAAERRSREEGKRERVWENHE